MIIIINYSKTLYVVSTVENHIYFTGARFSSTTAQKTSLCCLLLDKS